MQVEAFQPLYPCKVLDPWKIHVAELVIVPLRFLKHGAGVDNNNGEVGYLSLGSQVTTQSRPTMLRVFKTSVCRIYSNAVDGLPRWLAQRREKGYHIMTVVRTVKDESVVYWEVEMEQISAIEEM